MNILCFGAGVNSTAILALMKLGKLDLGDHRIVYADTQAENPSTYCHIKALQKEFEITILRKDQSLYDYCLEKQVMPSRMLRWCTDKWKIRPITDWIKSNWGEDYKLIYGFAKGEERRAKNNLEAMYPLLELGVDRAGCEKVIEEAGWQVPAKSGCYFCPFQRRLEWFALKENYTELFDKAVKLEDNARLRYPKMFLSGEKPLTSLDDEQSRLFPLESYQQHCLCAVG